MTQSGISSRIGRLICCACLATAGSRADALELELADGAFWEYLWTTESIDSVQGSGTTVDVSTGRFTITLGAPVTIAGRAAYPLSVVGETGDGEVDYRPRWTHLAVDGNGSLLGSQDGASLSPVLSASDPAQSGGYLIEFPTGSGLETRDETFEGLFNSFEATALRRQLDPDGCTFYPTIGVTVCPNDDPKVTINESEYFKDGLGPIGLKQYVNVTSDGGGFFTSFTDNRTVELIGTSLAASDGSPVNPPPWRERAALGEGRYRHGAAAFVGEIWVAGGLNDANEALASVEIYDPAQDQWRPGPALPSPRGFARVESAAGRLYVLTPGEPLLTLNRTRDGWGAGPTAPSFVDTCVIGDRYVMAVEEDGFGFSSTVLTPHFFDTTLGQWLEGISTSVTRILRFSIGCVGTDVIVTGGYRFATLSSNAGVTPLVLRYQAVGGEWSFIESMNQRRESHATALFKGRLMVFGGTSSSELRDVEFLRSSSARWEAAVPMFVPRDDSAAVTVADKVWVIGGQLNGAALDVVESLDAPDDVFRDGFESAAP